MTCMTIGSLKFDGDSHTSVSYFLGMTMLFDALTFLYKFPICPNAGLCQKAFDTETISQLFQNCNAFPGTFGKEGNNPEKDTDSGEICIYFPGHLW